ncbi:MAG TPA: histidine kinase dimerization/phospho-acceptor domain-containing protein, partial [Gammaproteobacteria bacterium]
MFTTLYARLAAVLCGLLLTIGVLFALLLDAAAARHQQELAQNLNRDVARRIVADRNLVAEGRLAMDALRETFSAYMEINPSIEIYLLDRDGRILSFSADPGKVKRQHVDLGPVRAFLAGAPFPLLGDDPRAHDRMKAFSVTPVPSAAAPEGYLYVVLRGEQYEAAARALQRDYLLRLSGWAIAGSLGFGLFAGLLLFHLLTRRLQRLAHSIEGFQQGGFSAHAPFAAGTAAGDEIDRLGRAFDEMAARIVTQLQQLKGQDRARRELVAQVSHDLRTPLAAVIGYLETLALKGDALADAQRAEYLEIALRQGQRLGGMVDALFELARLEARELEPELEPVNLAELLQDVVQKYVPRATAAAVRLTLQPPPGLPAVAADLALLERVLDNLLDNALEHAPQGGAVELALARVGDSVEVSVSDRGPG